MVTINKQKVIDKFVGKGLEGFTLMMEEPNCSKRGCKHWLGFLDPTGQGVEGTVPFCVAFPDGIPDNVAWGDNPHTRPIDGDGGTRFEKE